MIDVNKFESMQIGLASPDKIRSWSYGEVKKPETINYRTLKPEKQGLFDERIFGPTKDYECACGKYKRIRYKGRVCDRCGVEVTSSKVRRERMGHIELAAPVSHIWYFKGIPSRMGLVLDMSPRSLEEVIYFASYVVLDPGDTPLEKKQLLSEAEYRDKKAEFGDRFTAEMGAAAIKKLLADVDLEKEAAELKEELKEATGQKRTRAIRRLDILEAFIKSGNKPEWMVLDVIPVMPPDLRPMVQLEGGRFATSDLNDLYRRVINRNNRLKRLLKLQAPGIIVQNEKRMLQEAVDALIDNGRRGRPVSGPGNRPLKSLSHLLKGKQGRFRQNLLGKRVDYSGRSVIDVGPSLRMNQMGLPVPMALELFKPFIMHELVKRGLSANVKAAKRKIDRRDDDVFDVLEDVIKEHPVLLNRAPTLHRLGIQAFEPILVSGKSMRLHPLVCTAYNADFDGDQMAIHVPLSDEAQAEARLLMLAASHILSPRDGEPIVSPSQDMVIGNYYMTTEDKGREGEGMIFKDTDEAEMAYRNNYVSLQTRVGVQVSAFPDKPFTEEQRGKIMVTSVGKLLFNRILPKDFNYINEPTADNITNGVDDRFFLDPGENINDYLENAPLVPPFKKGFLSDLIAEVYKKYKVTKTSLFLDRIKDLGYYESTISGLTTAMSDIHDLPEKPEIIKKARKQVNLVTKQFRRGLITDDERYDRVIGIWNDAKDEVQNKLIEHMDIHNPINMMSDSGARGNISNFTQLAGMRGLMASPNGKIMELPVLSNFYEGLSVLEMFISSHGARKGMTDTALKTANSGYLTRRLVDVAQDVVVREKDCGTDRGLEVTAITNGNEMIEPLYDRIMGRYTMKSVFDPKTGEKIVGKNVLIDEEMAQKIVDAGVKKVTIRSAFTCNTEHGVCERCYGRNAATGDRVEAGEAVGTVAAQSIGEPGTQLTLRNFHTGGVAGNDDITQGLPRIQEIVEARNPKGRATITEVTGEVESIEENPAERTKDVTVKGETDTRTYTLPITARMRVAEGDFIHRGSALNEGSIDPKELIRVRDVLSTETYLLAEVQKVYRMQGIDLLDKHVEIMIRQMMRKVRVMDPGDTDMLPGQLMDIGQFRDANYKTLIAGNIPATARPVILGITKAALETNSFLSAASFQETTRVLTDAAIRGKNDPLVGLKENVIIGKIIPAGTGMSTYRNIKPKEVNVAAYSIKDLEAKMKEEDKQN
ncbi:DNA-directed RNA polymerase subunit beta' [Limosilactobacillus fastidiosus]|uniref:DNA-directed RNA polymerase subunit beta' n=1 Tax=Limosilactobacillus fastidiosus TaxID=2759855 RepID=A0A7W3TZ42_9LACO|nr:DNA-directed RNA polymerase subunit beta' [Limosilactobacillus fastidiosus]MBB1063344.1 DNA-directed RNA polymerase subunit beta' [Limosilactobacillus fastidiosus]MBB1085974.1 DNA-directed RNA polymerase subunit beta' [Limosilactobacillus fastidiosus]MCD7084613.1 DNA-directed RNA polymerase subunit beta' [Limosilactobacillus fastidiosus]MCD7085689.1 DNA-directed RNA polymerase subunit beta' [Limosilactobacillus fastidiosus]MCD7114103.1 DNA-directed RNA polymerase subunit beta' [Limosilactob